MNEDRQRELLMAQLNNKRALKQKYLRQETTPEPALAGLVMTNVMLFAVKERADIFSALRRLQADPNGASLFSTVLDWLETLAEVLGCGVYELLIDDAPKRRRIVEKLLRDLESCDSWENIHTDGQGGGSFALPGFDYAYRMSQQPSATLLFEKTAAAGDVFRYTLTLGDGQRSDLIPSQGVLWQETRGPLQAFTDRVLAELDSGWPVLKERFDQVSRQLQAEAETLRDLTALLEEVPNLDLAPLLRKESEKLRSLRQQEQSAYGLMPEAMQASGRGRQVQNTLLLLGGAVSELEKLLQAMPETPGEKLSEVVYLLEGAAEPL